MPKLIPNPNPSNPLDPNPYYAGMSQPVEPGVASFAELSGMQANNNAHPLEGLWFIEGEPCPVCGHLGPVEVGKVLNSMWLNGTEVFLLHVYEWDEEAEGFAPAYRYMGMLNTSQRFYDKAEDLPQGFGNWSAEHDACLEEADQSDE